jgi:hypothetical protein
MKKTYFAPSIQVINTTISQQILSGSVQSLGGEAGSGTVGMSREVDFDFDGEY